MNCESMLAAMLDAEPDALAGGGDSPLAMHLRGCARCRATASRLVADTQHVIGAASARRSAALRGAGVRGVALRGAGVRGVALHGTALRLKARPTGRGRYVRPVVVGGILAAATVVLAVVRREVNPGGARKLVPGATVAALPRNSVTPRAGELASTRPQAGATVAKAPVGSATVANALVAKALVVKAPVAKAHIAKAHGVARDSLFVGVSVAANVRATVIRTNNPKFTVVWLY